MRNLTKAILTLGAAWAAMAGVAPAQDDQAVGVRERPRPEYDAIGIHAGGFTLFPMIQAGATFEDNVFAVVAGAKSDTIGELTPVVRLNSNWSSNELDFTASGTSRYYSSYSALNSTDWRVEGYGRLDVVRDASIDGDVSYFDGIESLLDNPIPNLAKPIEYTQLTGNFGGQWSAARTKFVARLQSDKYDFKNGTLLNGFVVDQNDRDRTVTQFTGRADYSVSPDTAVFVSASGNWRDYRLRPPVATIDRNSDGYNILAGFNFGVTRLIHGDLGVGYLHQTYDQPGVPDLSGFAANVKLEWLPTEVVTVTGTAARQVGDSGVGGTASIITSQAGVTADYEFRRDIILSAGAAYYQDDYNNISRRDDRWSAMLSGDYMLNRVAAVFVKYSYWDQNSNDAVAGRIYKVNDVSIGLRLRR
jgi:hypothetical protein